ncbi:MAG: [protein-PII] uridylyltransferase [Deltaproteobacteria bacterium]|nr:[protein-PII] uridylyltransferase [Deltaproteobacteria bacterium]
MAAAYLSQGRETVLALHRSGASGRTCVRATTELIDRLLCGLFAALGGDSLRVALLALGGYGRRELAPFSDLDLLLLHEGDNEEAVASFAQRLLYLLWDLRLDVGWGVRTPEQCLRLAEEDHTALTSLLDARFLAGVQPLGARFEEQIQRELLSRRSARLVEDKLAELERRRERFGDTVFLLEPDLKQGEGGLRDLQGAMWIVKARFHVPDLEALARRALLPVEEVRTLMDARDFLWRVRNELHLQAGRRDDRLTFDRQLTTARQLGYQDSPEGLAVEHFMRHVYLASAAVQRAADALLDRCREAGRRGPPSVRRVEEGFKVFNGRLALTSADLFERDPAALVRAFAVADREGVPLSSFVRDRISREAGRIDEAVRSSPEVASTLREMLVRPGTHGGFLRAMHELGILERLVPELRGARGRAQHDLYHVYTVDLHCLFTAMKLYQLRNGELAESEPALSRRMQSLEPPLALLVAALLHDAAKSGVPGHAERGAPLARASAQRLGLSPEEVEDAQWLVRHHLAMTHISQRRDLSDEALIADFARQVRSERRLKMLQLLTFADLCSVAPNTWNPWRAKLLEELYERTLQALEGRGEVEDRRSRLLAALADRKLPEGEALLASLPERYLRSTSREEAVRHARLMRRARKAGHAASLLHRMGYSELILAVPDRPGLLALLTGALAAHRIGILRASIFSTSDGWALDTFVVRGGGGGRLERERWRAARADLLLALAGQLDIEELLRRRGESGLARRAQPHVETHVAIDNRAAQDATVIDVYARDRVGLLHTLARTLYEHGAEILLAKVATEGNQVADSFYVRIGGSKISSMETLAELETALRRAVAG